jgi:AcrR family transcriptional regulator
MRAPGGTPSRAQLPPGRHGLPRSFVAQNQRERILAAVADVTSAASYSEMTVADIIVCAGVSRRTFYEHFENKQSAYLAAYDEAVGRLLQGVRWAYSTREDFAARVRAAIEMFVTVVSADPAFARMCLVEVMGAGVEALRRRDAAMAEFAGMLDENARALLDNPPARIIAETVVGGLYEVMYSRILRGELRELPGLLPDLVHALLLPYLGPERALAERDKIATPAAVREQR